MFGRPGPAFIDLPANIIMGTFEVDRMKLDRLLEAPKPAAPADKVQVVAEALKNAKAPLVVLGKGAAYSRAEKQIRTLIDRYALAVILFIH